MVMIFMTHRLWVVHAFAAIQIHTEIVTFVVHDEKSILLHFNDVANGQDQDDARNSIGFSSKSYRMQSQSFALNATMSKRCHNHREREKKKEKTLHLLSFHFHDARKSTHFLLIFRLFLPKTTTTTTKNSQMTCEIHQKNCRHSTMPHENSTEPKMFHEILAYRRIIRIEAAWATKRSPVQQVP